MDNIQNCQRCKEDAILVSWDGHHMVRVRRATKCKFYRPSKGVGGSDTCRTPVYETADEAIAEWNRMQR